MGDSQPLASPLSTHQGQPEGLSSGHPNLSWAGSAVGSTAEAPSETSDGRRATDAGVFPRRWIRRYRCSRPSCVSTESWIRVSARILGVRTKQWRCRTKLVHDYDKHGPLGIPWCQMFLKKHCHIYCHDQKRHLQTS